MPKSLRWIVSITLALAAAPVLAAGFSPTPQQLLGPNPLPCKNTTPAWQECTADIKVGPGYVDAAGVEHKDGCHAIFPYNGFEVAPKAKRWLVWKIVKDTTGDPDTYRFRLNDPVALNPADNNDPNQDLDQPGFGSDPQTYRWKDKNKRLRDGSALAGIRFDFFVIRERDQAACISADPAPMSPC